MNSNLNSQLFKNLDVIYQPKGKAQEYAEAACNVHKGCTHGCRYCYASRFNTASYYLSANPKENIIERIKADLFKIQQYDTFPEVLFSFLGDVYQPEEKDYQLMPEIIRLFIEYKREFSILTKGCKVATRDFSSLRGYGGFKYGVSLVFDNQQDIQKWEPKASSLNERILSLKQAKLYGFTTFLSLEPVIDPIQAIHVVHMLHDYVDYWKIGKINYNKELENNVNWSWFRDKIIETLEKHNCNYMLKRSLIEL